MTGEQNPFESTKGDIPLGETVSLRAAGVYEPGFQLSDEQVVEMKQRFRREPELVGSVAVHIVEKLFEDDDPGLDADEVDDYKFLTRIDWARCLEGVVRLPGAEWPKDVTPPATFAVALQELDAIAGQEKSDG